MKPLLNIIVRDVGEPRDGAIAGIEARVPRQRRDRVVFQWPETGRKRVLEEVRRARAAGFKRVRVAYSGSVGAEPEGPGDAVGAGADEIEIDPLAALSNRELPAIRGSRALAYLKLKTGFPVSDGARPGLVGNPSGADELELMCPVGANPSDVDSFLGEVGDSYRRISIRGIPLCSLTALAPGKVLANAMEAEWPHGVLDARFERADAVYFGQCRDCGLTLACDGFGYGTLRDAARVSVRPFDSRGRPVGTAVVVGPSDRVHPPSFFSGLAHVLGVSAGIRPCARIVVRSPDLDRQVHRMNGRGLHTAVVDAQDAPQDYDTGSHGPGGLSHLFFSSGAGDAERAAGLQREFAAAEKTGRPIGPAAFAEAMGRALGYPECCIQAFLDAGPLATTADLLRASHARSRRFDWRLNCLDPLSPFTVVPHVPCAFDCEASIGLANGVLGALARDFPFLDGTAKELLGRTLLFVDSDLAVAFDGAPDADGRGVGYEVADAVGARPGSGGSGSRPAAGQSGDSMSTFWSSVHVRVDGNDLVFTDSEGRVVRKNFGEEALIFPFS